MDRNMLVFAITKGLLRKYNEAVAGIYSVEDFIEDLLYGIYVLERIIGDITLSNHFRYMAHEIIDKYTVGFVRHFLLKEGDIDFDAYDIKEKIWFLILYSDEDLGTIGNAKKKIILDDVEKWFENMYMEVKWNESDEFVELLTLMSHVKAFDKLPINDVKDAIHTILLHRYNGEKPHWGLYWLTGNTKYITEMDMFDRRAWVFWRDKYR